MDKIIPFNKGIRRSPSIGEAGELSELVNLVPKGGELVNAKEMVKIGNLTSSTPVTLRAIHKVIGGETKIASRGNVVRCEYSSGNTTKEYEFSFSSNVVNVCVVGNTVVVSCENSVNYLLFRNGGYVNLGNGLPNLSLQFGLAKYNRMSAEQEIAYDEKLTKETQLYDILSKRLNEDKKSYFVSPFFVRYAYRLYDDSLVYHSTPILMPCNTLDEILFVVTNSETISVGDLTYEVDKGRS